MKKILLLGILMISIASFAETLTGSFVSKIHQISGEVSLETTGKEITISNFTYDGNGKNVYLILTKDGDFKDMKIISKELKKGYVNEQPEKIFVIPCCADLNLFKPSSVFYPNLRFYVI